MVDELDLTSVALQRAKESHPPVDRRKKIDSDTPEHSKTDKAQGQIRFCSKLTKSLRNRVNPGKAQEADDQISKRSHDAGSIAGPNP